MPMNNRLLRPLQTPGLLDLVPGAAAAYSLRSLSRSYAGPVVTVRRSSDDAEDSFTASEVADGTLAAFCGAGDGLVTQWWDQSGNARHVTQSTAGKQPAVVSSGVLEKYDGKPALYFDGVDDTLERDAAFIGANDMTVASLQAFADDPLDGAVNYTAAYYGDPSANADYINIIYRGSSTAYEVSFRAGASGQDAASSHITTDPYGVIVARRVSSTASLRFSAITAGDTTGGEIGVDVTGDLFLMSFRDVAWTEGHMLEHIIWLRDLEDQTELIEGQIAWSYSQ